MKETRTKRWKKVLSGFLAASMMLSPWGGSLGTAKADVPGSDNVILHYDMTAENGYLKDISGKGNHGTIHNIPDSAFSKELGDTILTFPGTSNSYVDLPLSVLNDMDYKTGFTVEIALIPQSAQYQFLWTLGTGDSTDYIFFNPKLGSGNINVATKTDGVEESIPGCGDVVLNTKNFNVVTVTSEGKTLTLYVDGVKKGTLNHSRNLDAIFKGNGSDILGYLAKSNWGADPYCDAIVTDFKIYNKTLTDSEVASVYQNSNYVYAKPLIEEDIQAVDLGNISSVMNDLVLPAKGSVNDSVITWKSSDTAVIADDGTVNAAKETKKVELTAVFALNGVDMTKVYTVYVTGTENKDQVILDQYLNLPYYLTANDVLPMQVNGESVTWTSDNDAINTKTGAITPKADEVTDAALTADVNGKKRSYKVKVLGADQAYILSYTRQADADKDGMYNEEVCNSMHLGYSADGKSYEALLHNTGVLFAKADHPTTKLLKSPYIFRMKDGSFGVLAVRINKEENIADADGSVLFFTSKDLVAYEEVGMLTISDSEHIENPACVYDAQKDVYRITWTGLESKLSYVTETQDFKTFGTKEVSAPIAVTTADTQIDHAVEGNVIGITAAEETYILNKLGQVTNTSVEVLKVTTTVGNKVDLTKIKATANYSDGSSAEKTVIWNEEDLAKVDFDKAGTYTVNGTIRQISDQTDENDPFIERRADPTITKYNGKYYFIATTEAAVDNNYGLFIRESDTITGLNEAEEHLVFNLEKAQQYGYYAPSCHWAPELHVVNGELYMFFSVDLGGTFNVQSMLMKLTGDDPTDYNDWGELKQFLNKDGDPLTEPYGGITLDMTHFVYNNRHYVVWSQRNFGKNGGTADLWIGEIDPAKPYQLISDSVRIVDCEYGWERNRTFVTEGPNTIIRDGKLYLTYSGGATDETYCVGMTTIDLNENTNFLDPASWTKSNYPILTGLSVDGLCGPGHNAYVEDTDGTLINVFHAKKGVYGSRDAFLRIVHFGADGTPILDMVEEREILPENKSVTLTVTVEAAEKLPFTDVNSDYFDKEITWYYQAVKNMFERGLMTGMDKEKTYFGAYEEISRAQFAVILYRMEGEPEATYKNEFPDVKETDATKWYTSAVAWANEEGLITGYTHNGHFGAADPITREQMATILYRYAQWKGYDVRTTADFSTFKDGSAVSKFAEEPMAWAVGNAIITGKDKETRLDPQGTAKRSECAVILDRFINAYF